MPSAPAARAEERADFLSRAGWSAASSTPLAGDASTRSYDRLRLGERTALLMNAPPAAESAACPPDASPEQRRALGYNAQARLAGPNLNAFTAIAAALRGAGLSAPEIYAADARTGFALIEDFGDALFARAIPAGADERALYERAIDALLKLRAAAPSVAAANGYAMLAYDRMALEAEIGLLAEWYWPFRTAARPHSSQEALWFAAWAPVLDALSEPSLMVLRDYHAENLLWLEARPGPRAVGLIDFQDGLVGAPAYDLVSLLEDARRDVAPALAEAMIARYCAGARAQGAFDESEFLRDYAILAAQRNAKILGIFARLARRDGKPRYAALLPRVEAHFRRDLARPALGAVRVFCAAHLPDLAA
jgi:hypothetical protein